MGYVFQQEMVEILYTSATITWSCIIRMRVFIKIARVPYYTESALALQRSIFRENRTNVLTFIAR